jgi:hypothetical protein
MAVKVRFPEPTSIKDEATRRYLNELLRSLNSVLQTIVVEDEVYGIVEDILVAGSGMALTADVTTKTITVATSV